MAGRLTHSKPHWQAIRDRAAEWVVRLADHPHEAEGAEFRAWIAADLAHEIAFEQEQATWRRMGELAALRALDIDAAGLLQDEPPVRRAPPSRRRWTPPVLGRRAFLGGGLAAAGLGGFAVWMATGSTAYATGVGERRSLQLGAHGRVELNTQTLLLLHRTLGEPELELRSGEALFDLKGTRDRDLAVRAGGTRVHGPQATFSIRRDTRSLQLAVLDGVVELRGEGRGAAPAISLDRGSVLTVGPNGVSSRRAAEEELERALSWRYGKISLAGEPLSRAAAEFNRYNAKQIVVSDPAVAALAVGGYFNADDVDGFVRGVEETFPVRAIDRGSVVYLVPAPD